MIKRLLLIPIFAIFVEGCSKLTNDQIVYLECQISPIETFYNNDENDDRKFKRKYKNTWIYSINNEDKLAYYYLKTRAPEIILGTVSLDILTFNKEYIFLRKEYDDSSVYDLDQKLYKSITEVSIDRNNGDFEQNDYVYSDRSNFKKLDFQILSKGKCKKANPPKTKF